MKQRVPDAPVTLIATLGSEPQVVTAALDLLLAQGEPIRQVVVLHTAGWPPVDSAVEVLRRAFAGAPYAAAIRLELEAICDQDGCPLADVETPQAVEAGFRALYRQVWHRKQAGERLHLSLAGGRKTQSAFAMLTAQMLFDEQDCLWHLYSAGAFLESRRLHPDPQDEVHLIAIPLLLRDYISPALTHLREVADPYQALERIRSLRLKEKVEMGRSFVEQKLTAGERRVVALLVGEGLGDQEIGERLSLSPRTVERHLRSAYLKATAHWELPAVSRAQLVALLQLYFSFQIEGKPA